MSRIDATANTRPGRWYLMIIVAAVALAGYFGPWVPHPAAGLVITGLDLAEYVKFLPEVAAGKIALLREAFYAPLAAGSLIASLLSSRRALPRALRGLLLVAAAVLALAMLPPAWTPTTLRSPEFRIQTVAILACLTVMPLTALIRYVPNRLVWGITGILAVPAAVWAAWSFLRVRPAIEAVYNAALPLGWGFWTSLAGWLVLAALSLAWAISPRRG